MRISRVLSGLTFGAVMLALLPAAAQRGSGTMLLTADDHVQMQQLVTRFGYALDTGAGDGAMFADLFTEDGVFGAATGRSQLAALARARSEGAANRHFVSNVIIEPAERGATGTQYEAVFAIGKDDRELYERRLRRDPAARRAICVGARYRGQQGIHLCGLVRSGWRVQRHQGTGCARGTAARPAPGAAVRPQLRSGCDHPADARRGDRHPVRAGDGLRAGWEDRRPRSFRSLRGCLHPDSSGVALQVAAFRERIAGSAQSAGRSNRLVRNSTLVAQGFLGVGRALRT